MEYHYDYPSKKIGGGNPYHCCRFCEVSDPQINGQLDGHRETCPYRIEKEAGIWIYRETYDPEED